ncbi:hypothetical protein GGQ22_12565 [Nocardioides sp. zg-579]|uniref:SMP-30/gluconolactonase/LRE family protein n=1 Tax=Nocardioides marmotae TaxID=2663857 RepID=A0A6I3JCU2_9ACTN|nr:hypothetical protein [Nocardioides marmotae]MCR6032264.1 hypothetical protein [Gordonia jinghuaiqii]MTB95912.1 hypothetical protein [Nocardioides marmotae]QKE02746.1 hypothetical protein HPC71_17970 [Nocardioides marmotae]
MNRIVALLAALVLGLPLLATAPAGATGATGAAGAAPAAAEVPKWRTKVFSLVPAPGYPAYVHAHTNGRVYAGTYVNGSATGVPSRVFEWSAGGQLLRSWPVPGQVTDGSHGVQVAQQTRDGRLVVLETSTRRVLTLDVRTGRWRRVATFPEGAVPNYAAWGPRGELYVSDYAQPIVWRVPPRGGTPRAWFTAPALEGTQFGTTGLVYRPGRGDLVLSQQWVLDGSQLPTTGAVLSLGVRPGGRPGELRTLWRSGPMELPDGFGIGRSGHLYVALLGTNQLVELTARGAEVDRFPDVPLLGENGSAIPFDTPCSATFLGTSVLVANQSVITGTSAHQAILRVEVGERGKRVFVPQRARLGR